MGPLHLESILRDLYSQKGWATLLKHVQQPLRDIKGQDLVVTTVFASP